MDLLFFLSPLNFKVLEETIKKKSYSLNVLFWQNQNKIILTADLKVVVAIWHLALAFLFSKPFR